MGFIEDPNPANYPKPPAIGGMNRAWPTLLWVVIVLALTLTIALLSAGRCRADGTGHPRVVYRPVRLGVAPNGIELHPVIGLAFAKAEPR